MNMHYVHVAVMSSLQLVLLFRQNLSLTPEAKIEATMQHEIIRLTSENLVSGHQCQRKYM